MPTETDEVEYRTVQIGAALLVKGILERLGVVQVIDQSLKYQVVMIGDRKLSNRETMLAFCRTEQFSLAALPGPTRPKRCGCAPGVNCKPENGSGLRQSTSTATRRTNQSKNVPNIGCAKWRKPCGMSRSKRPTASCNSRCCERQPQDRGRGKQVFQP